MTVACVYRFFDASDDLLYIGTSTNLSSRLSSHRSGQPWWGDVARIAVEHFSSHGAALAAEVEAIRDEDPKWNRRLPVDATLAARRRTRVARLDEKAQTYHARTICRNCGSADNYLFRVGRLVSDTPCAICELKTLDRKGLVA